MATEAGQWRIVVGEGVCVIAPGGGDVTPRAKKARALIAYLAATPGRTADRSTLIALLWSDRANEQARASLRQCLFELRSQSPGLIDADGDMVALNAVVAIGGNGPLSPLDRIDPAFDHWLATRRESWKTGVEVSSAVGHTQRRGRLAALAGLTLIGLFGLWLALRPAPPHPPVLMLTPLAGATDLTTHAATIRFAETTRAMLASSRVRLLPGDEPRYADWVAGGSVGDGAAVVRLTTPAGALLWSARETVGSDGIVAAADRLGDRTARALACAAGGPPARRGATVTAMLIDFCDAMQSAIGANDFEPVLARARRLVAAAPHDAYAHGHLAATLAYAADGEPTSIAQSAQAEAGREATTALTLDSRTGEAWLARAMLARGHRNLGATESAIQNGLAVEPDNPHLLIYFANLLKNTGRLSEALIEGQRGLAFYPASVPKRSVVAELLSRNGSLDAALALLNQTGAYDPSHLLLRQRVTLLLWNGDTAGVRAEITAAGDAFEPGFAAEMIGRTRAINNPHGPEAAALLAQVAASRDMPDSADFRLIILANLGRTDEALNVALHAPVETEIFFRPNTRALLLSPRFPDVARVQGLWAYWQATGQWPDICTDPALGWRCPVKNPSTPR